MLVSLCYLLLFLALPGVEIRMADGTQIRGRLANIDKAGISVETKGESRRISHDELLEIAFPAAVAQSSNKSEPAAEERISVKFLDGTTINALDFTANAERAVVIRQGEESQLTANVKQVASVLFATTNQEAETALANLERDKLSSDVLLLLRQGTVHQLQGLVRGVTENEVNFDVGDEVPVPRDRVLGIVYFHPSDEPLPKPFCMVETVKGGRWYAAELSQSDEELSIRTAFGAAAVLRQDEISRIDYSFAKVAYLNELQPEVVRFTPLFSLSGRISPWLENYYKARLEHAAENTELQLGEHSCRHGLALSTGTELVYRTEDEFKRFRAMAVSAGKSPSSPIKLDISVDGQVKLSTLITGENDPLPIDVDVRGARRLRFIVGYGKDVGTPTELFLCEARLIR